MWWKFWTKQEDFCFLSFNCNSQTGKCLLCCYYVWISPPPRHFSHTVGTLMLFSPESDSIREGVCIILLCLALADRWHCHHTESIWKTHFFFTHHMLQALGIMQKMTFSHLIIYVGRSIGAKTSSSTSILHVSPWKINLLIKDLP